VSIVREVLEDRRYEIVLVVDHAAAAASVMLDLRPTQVVFARPPRSLERTLLRRSDTIGIDLPVKVLVFEDESGDIQLRYNPVGYLADRHDIPPRDGALWLLRLATKPFGDLNDGLVTVPSNRSLDETVAALQEAIGANPAFRVPLVLDYGQRSRRRDGPVLIVFGNPNAGTPLMQRSQEVALDLPQKFLVWQDRGDTFITYNDPLFVGRRHNVQGQDARLQAIANALDSFAAAGGGW
jgi:uncharacterized protein (DUF302 family)